MSIRLLLISFTITLSFNALTAFGSGNNLVYESPYLLDAADQSLIAPIYKLGYSDALDQMLDQATEASRTKSAPIFKREIYDYLRAMNPPSPQSPSVAPANPDQSFGFEGMHYDLSLKSLLTITPPGHPPVQVDLSQIPEYSTPPKRDISTVLSASPDLSKLAFAVYEQAGVSDFKVYFYDLTNKATQLVYECSSCFTDIRWNGTGISAWLKDSSEFWIAGTNGGKTASRAWVRISKATGAAKSHSENFAQRHSFINIGTPLLTDDSNYIVLTSGSHLARYDRIYSAQNGAPLFDGFRSASKKQVLDFVVYREKGDFFRIRSADQKIFTFSDLNCSTGKCKDTLIAVDQPLHLSGETDPTMLEDYSKLCGDWFVTVGYEGLHPTVETFNLKTHELADYNPPIQGQDWIKDFDPATNTLIISGPNDVMEQLDVKMDIRDGKVLSIQNEAPTQFTNYTSSLATSISADGTSVPITILTPKGIVVDANTPLMVYGYGEYGTPAITQWMSREHLAPLLNLGYVIAYAHIRGGGDLGKAWQAAGDGQNKIKGIEDFEAVLRTLHKNGISSPDLTSIKGFSAGGNITSMLLARHPELFKTAFVAWGETDAIDIALDPRSYIGNVERESTIGDPLNPDLFAGIYARSGMQSLDGIPKRNIVWITASKDDVQVNPWFPLGYYTKVKRFTDNVYFYVSQSGGHIGYSSDEEMFQELTSEYSLLESLR